MLRKAFRLRVKPSAHAEYRRRHDALWPEMRDTLLAHGVRSYSIFLDPPTSSLFAYAEIDSLAQWESIATTPVCRRWWAFMADIMDTNPDGSPATTDLAEVFHLSP